MIGIIMINKSIKIDIYQIVKIGEYHSEVEYNMDKIMDITLNIIRTMEIIAGEEIS